MSTATEDIRIDLGRYVSRAQLIPYLPVTFVRGEGAVLYDENEKRYLDFLASASSANIGHGNPEIARAVYEQMSSLAQYTQAYFPSRPAVELAKKLAELSGRPDMMVAFACTGSASVDGAIKYARGFTGRRKILSFSGSYHGSTYGAISVSNLTNDMRRRIGPLLPDCEVLGYPDCSHCRYGEKRGRCGFGCLKELSYALEHYIPADEVAAVIVEPLAVDGGLVIPSTDYLRGLRELCTENGILLISDEINVGLGRTGKMFAMDHHGVDCDLYVLGKSLGAGLPLGAVIGRREILSCLDTPAHVFTMSGNAACCAASLKMFEIMERDRLFEETVREGRILEERLRRLMDRYAVIGEVRGFGLCWGVELVTDRESMGVNYPAAAKISYYCLKHGLVQIFVARNTLRIQPPLVITDGQLDEALGILEQAFAELDAGRLPDSILEEITGW